MVNGAITNELPDGGAEVTFPDEQAVEEQIPEEVEFRHFIETTNIVDVVQKVKKAKFPSYTDSEVKLTGEEVLKQIGSIVVQEYESDRLSRHAWEEKVKDAIKTFTAFLEGDTTNKSRVMLPLVAIATLQFHARAYDSLLPPKRIVRAVSTQKQSPENIEKAKRVEQYMNYDLLYNMDEFVEGMDTSLMQLPLFGSVFRKTYYDTIKKKNASEYVSSMDIVMNYKTDPFHPERLSQVYDLSINDIRIRANRGIFVQDAWDLGELSSINDTSVISEQIKKSDGTEEPTGLYKRPRRIIEQHRNWDLDGDGIEEAYVITVDEEQRKVLRITSRVAKDANGEEVVIDYYTHYRFLPNPEGSYGLGFWVFMGHMNEAANAIVNEVIDAGALQNMQGGFINKRANVKKGQLRFKRGEYKAIDIVGDDIRKAIYSFNFQGPSTALFQVLGLLMEYSKLVSTVSETMEGKLPSSDTTATAVVQASEEGRRLFNSVYRRQHRSFLREVKKIFQLNSVFLDEEMYFNVIGNTGTVDPTQPQSPIGRADFTNTIDLTLVSDPNIISTAEKIAKAKEVIDRVMGSPFTGNDLNKVRDALGRYYEALGVENYETLLPQPEEPRDIHPIEENSLFLQEQGSQVLPNQNHEEHISIMDAFQESGFFGQLTPHGSKLFEAHKREHIAQLYLAVNQPTEEGGLDNVQPGGVEGVV